MLIEIINPFTILWLECAECLMNISKFGGHIDVVDNNLYRIFTSYLVTSTYLLINT